MSDRAPLPFVRWLARSRAADRRARRWLGAAAAGATLIGVAAALDFGVRPAPRLVWNASASAPIGLWRIDPHAAYGVGDMVLAATPASVRRLAAERRYLPTNVPLLKRVVAADGDLVCAPGPWIYVNARLVATRREADRLGRPLPWWRGCRRLKNGAVLLLMDAPGSFDGRYFGPVPRAAVIGKATPLWLR